jgi:hypothetical protein
LPKNRSQRHPARLRWESATHRLFYGFNFFWPYDLEKLLLMPLARGPGMNVNESERERSGIICRHFCGVDERRLFFEVPYSLNFLTYAIRH